MDPQLGQKLDRIIQLLALIAALLAAMIVLELGVGSAFGLLFVFVVGGFVLTALMSAVTGKQAVRE